MDLTTTTNERNLRNTFSRFVQHSGLLKLFSAAELDTLIPFLKEVDYNKGELVIKQGSPVSNVFFLVEGLLKQFDDKSSGIAILWLILPGELFGFNSAISSDSHRFSVEAVMESKILIIEKENFLRLLRANPLVLDEVLRMMAEVNIGITQRLENSMVKRLPGKLAGALLFFSRSVFHSNQFTMPVTISELACYIGASKGRTMKALNQFVRDGLIKRNDNQIEIINTHTLVNLARFG